MPDTQTLGTDNLKNVIGAAIDTVAISVGTFGDGVQLSDIKVLPSLGKDAVTMAQDLKAAIAEAKDLDADEVQDLLSFTLEKISALIQ